MSEINVKLRKQGDLWVCELDKQEYGFRKWAWGEKSSVTTQCIKQTPYGPTLDLGEFNLSMLMATLKKSPFKVDRQTILSHPDSRLIDLLIQVSSKLNLIGNVEVENL